MVVEEGKEERCVGDGSVGGLLQINNHRTIQHVPQCTHVTILGGSGLYRVRGTVGEGDVEKRRRKRDEG